VRVRARYIALSLASVVLGVIVAAAIGTAGAANQTTVTLGSTNGAPSMNICVASSNCTYLPFSSVSSPELQVPFDGTVTSFSVNSGSSTGRVELRVLRPAANGQYTGAGTSAAETLNGGGNTYTVSMPVKSGDLLGLDNDSSALMFDNSDANALTKYYELPSLADGNTAAPNKSKPGFRLLLNAVVVSSPTATTTQTTTNTTTTILTTLPPGQAPAISNARATPKRFRVAAKATPVIARAPKGTIFRFTLSAPSRVQIAITHKVKGLRKGSKCVKPTAKLRRAHARACERTVTAGRLTRTNENAGFDSVAFSGRIGSGALKPGGYRAVLSARNTGGSATPVALSFKVVR